MIRLTHENVIIRRDRAVDVLRSQLLDSNGHPKFASDDTRMVFCSPLVDCAPNMTMARETAVAIRELFSHTSLRIRLLSKFSLLPEVVTRIPEKHWPRIVCGVSTGTFDEDVRRAIEPGTASIAQRLKSLYRLQDLGISTYGMVCPSLPLDDPRQFAEDAARILRVDRMEHYWAEVMNLRGESFTRTLAGLSAAGLGKVMTDLAKVCGVGAAKRWERYARTTFLAHASVIPPEKLRFLQYVQRGQLPWWQARVNKGAILLGHFAQPKNEETPI
jgi:DNA repair photolyase